MIEQVERVRRETVDYELIVVAPTSRGLCNNCGKDIYGELLLVNGDAPVFLHPDCAADFIRMLQSLVSTERSLRAFWFQPQQYPGYVGYTPVTYPGGYTPYTSIPVQNGDLFNVTYSMDAGTQTMTKNGRTIAIVTTNAADSDRRVVFDMNGKMIVVNDGPT